MVDAISRWLAGVLISVGAGHGSVSLPFKLLQGKGTGIETLCCPLVVVVSSQNNVESTREGSLCCSDASSCCCKSSARAMSTLDSSTCSCENAKFASSPRTARDAAPCKNVSMSCACTSRVSKRPFSFRNLLLALVSSSMRCTELCCKNFSRERLSCAERRLLSRRHWCSLAE